jgi:hypothetical protein
VHRAIGRYGQRPGTVGQTAQDQTPSHT